jgi:hypothetical protein
VLFHVTATHSEDNCPGFNRDALPDVMKGLQARKEIAADRGVKIVGGWSAAPEHVFYVVLEAESTHNIDLFLTEAIPFKQAFRVTPVMSLEELEELGKEMMSQG